MPSISKFKIQLCFAATTTPKATYFAVTIESLPIVSAILISPLESLIIPFDAFLLIFIPLKINLNLSLIGGIRRIYFSTLRETLCPLVKQETFINS